MRWELNLIRHMAIQFSPAPSIEGTALSPMYASDDFSKVHLTPVAWIFFCVLHSTNWSLYWFAFQNQAVQLLLLYSMFWVQVLQCLHLCSFLLRITLNCQILLQVLILWLTFSLLVKTPLVFWCRLHLIHKLLREDWTWTFVLFC